MILTIVILVALTIAIIVFGLAPRMAEARVVYRVEPDPPSPFGYKMAWLALRTRNTERVLSVLGLAGAEPANWESGIGTVYDETLGEHRVFVSPPVDGWTFVVGLALPYPVGRTFHDKCTPLLLDTAEAFEEVQYFFTYPLIDFFAWARLVDGKLVRAFAIGDEGIVWNKGKATREEKALGLKLFELRGVRDRKGDAGGELILHPTEEHVMRLARQWSVDPIEIDRNWRQKGVGYIAPAPAHWRPERMRKTA